MKIDVKGHFIPLMAYYRALVLMDPENAQTPTSVLEERDLDSVLVDVEAFRPVEIFNKNLAAECSRK